MLFLFTLLAAYLKLQIYLNSIFIIHHSNIPLGPIFLKRFIYTSCLHVLIPTPAFLNPHSLASAPSSSPPVSAISLNSTDIFQSLNHLLYLSRPSTVGPIILSLNFLDSALSWGPLPNYSILYLHCRFSSSTWPLNVGVPSILTLDTVFISLLTSFLGSFTCTQWLDYSLLCPP